MLYEHNSCQSHPYSSIVTGYVFGNDKTNFPISGLYYLEEACTVDKENLEHFEEELKSGKKVFEFRCKQFPEQDEAYIVFAEGYEPTSIPEGWENPEGSEDDKRMIICKTFDITDEWGYFRKRLEAMELLKKWADGLPFKD